MVVWVNGCFDILHTGHIELLEYAKNLANGNHNYLIVGIDSDRRVGELKGEGRPINSEKDRKKMLESLRFVDHVVIFDSDIDLENSIIAYDIEVMVIGDHYKNKKVIGSKYSKNGVLFFKTDERSTTNIIEKLKNL